VNSFFTQFAATEAHNAAEKPDIFTSLGIDWKLLVLQIVAFLILVWLLNRYVYPVFLRIVDERQSKIDESLKAARAAEKSAESAQDKIDEQLDQARLQAKDIVTTAKDEASAMLSKADEKSKANAEHMLETARDEIGKEVIAAKKALHNETIELVAQATEKVIGKTHTAKADASVISDALKKAEK